MKLQFVGGCDNSDCPKGFLTDRGTLVLQGYKVTDPAAVSALSLPDGETAVEIPRSLLDEMTARLRSEL
jgi:hypothetical protein